MERFTGSFEQNRMIEDWYHLHYTDLYHYAVRKLHNPEQTNDCIQEVFRIAAEKADVLKNHKNVGGWLMQTLKHQIAMYYRSEAAKQKLFRRIAERDDAHLILVDNLISDSEINGMKESILEGLTDRERQLYILFYKRGLQIKQIAAYENTTEAAVKMRLLRLRNKIYDRIKGFFG